MHRDLPNLDWLRVFAASADTSSFALAADRLGVTAGAVSQRIKALEAYIATPLFERLPQGVRLTDAGRRYAADVRPAVEQLRFATQALARDRTSAPVRVTVLPALAQLWLGPRLADFHRQHEGISVEIWADPAVIDMRAAPFDLAIRYANPPFLGCDYRPFLHDELIPVASPALLARCERDDLGLPVGMPLLLDTYWRDDYDAWVRATGGTTRARPTTQTFSLYSMVVEATLSGQGFMIGHTTLVADLIETGKLIELSPLRASATTQFHILTAQHRPPHASTRLFVDWLGERAL